MHNENIFEKIKRFSNNNDSKIGYELLHEITLLLIDTVLNRQYDLVFEIANVLNRHLRYNSPSVRKLVEGSIFTEENHLKFIERLIEGIASKHRIKNYKNDPFIAKVIYTKYSNYSLPDFYIFFDGCIKSDLIQEYEPIMKYGIMPMYLQTWFKRFNDIRLTDFHRYTEKVRSLKQKEKDIASRKVIKFPRFLKDRNEKYNTLATNIISRQKDSYSRFTTKQKILHHLMRNIIPYRFEFNEQHDTHRIATYELNEKENEWQVEFQDSQISKGKVNDDTEQIPTLSKDEFLNFRYEKYLVKINTELNKNARNILSKGIYDLVGNNEITSFDELILVLFPSKEKHDSKGLTLEEWITKLCSKLLNNFNEGYSKYKKSYDYINSKNCFDFNSKDLYLYKRAKIWVNRNCYKNINKNNRNIP